jgi:Tol biopolymer transport system component
MEKRCGWQYPLLMTFFDEGFTGTPRWSPDGKWIAFDYHPVTHGQIYLIDSDGRNMHVVTSGNYETLCLAGPATGRPSISPPTAAEAGRYGDGSSRPDGKRR